MGYKDPEVNRKYQRNWARNHKEECNKRSKNQRERKKTWLLNYKKTLKCEKCGETRPICLDFHHTGEKSFGISTGMFKYGYSLEKIMEEIKKCVVLCSNCHRVEHYGDGEVV